MYCKDTLRIKNLPKELSDAQKEDFVRHFGASRIKVVTSRLKEKSVVYAKFDSNDIARGVLFRLHQICVLNSRLCVEYADNDILLGKPPIKKIEKTDLTNKNYFKTFINKLNAFNDSVGFHQPPPAHLKYDYPKSNRATINNMAHALATIPRFYTQVLHLMNKMNLPPPFAVPDPIVRPLPAQPVVPQLPKPVELSKQSSSESELESDGEGNKNEQIIPQKRKLPQKKVVKRPKFIKPPIAANNVPIKPTEKPENVFEKVDVQLSKKIELKVTSENLEQVSENIPQKTGSFGIMFPLDKPVIDGEGNSEQINTISEETKQNKVITSEELAANQIALKDLGVLPVFKNYHPGAPTCRLYIKNCAKTVTVEDLEYIYNRYKEDSTDPDKPSQFDIRLMQEGRMKGQAFVTLDNVDLAQKAVKETNGYILKDKPLVVVFARSAAPKK